MRTLAWLVPTPVDEVLAAVAAPTRWSSSERSVETNPRVSTPLALPSRHQSVRRASSSSTTAGSSLVKTGVGFSTGVPTTIGVRRQARAVV